MKPKITRSDWIEIYYALESKLHSSTVQGTDHVATRWRKHIKSIIERIGPDGCNMYSKTVKPEQRTFAVIGRIPYDEEDRCYIHKARNYDEAVRKFKRSILKDSGGESPEKEDGKNVVYVNHVLESDGNITGGGTY